MNPDILFAVVPGITVLLFFAGIYKSLVEKQVKAQENVGRLLGESKAKPKGGMFPTRDNNDILKRRTKAKDGDSFIYKLEIKLERANLAMHPNEFIAVSISLAIVSTLVSNLLFGLHIGLALLVGGGCGFIPNIYIKIKTMLRMKKAAAQFADVLDAMVNGFKTGFGFSRAIQMIADNYDDPWGTEFGKMAAEMNLGATQEDALFGLASRIPSTDVDLFVTALLIQKETGGNMSELLGNLSKTCRDRYKLYQKVGAISAQGKLSAGIVSCIPFVLAGLMFLFLPDAMTKFTTNPIGIVLMIVAGIWMIMGFGVLYKIVNIEV